MPDGGLLSPDRAGPRVELIEPSLADIISLIQTDSALPKSKRDAWSCSLRQIARHLDRDLATLPARSGALRYGLKKLHHSRLGCSRKTLQNHVANLKAVLGHFSDRGCLGGRGVPLSPAWQVLYDRLPGKWFQIGLTAFMRYCSGSGVSPDDVSDTVVEAYVSYGTEIRFSKRPRELRRQVTRAWNRAREVVSDWPETSLTVPDFRPKPKSLPPNAFPPGFADDVERYLNRLAGKSLLDEDAPDRPCKPATIEIRRRYIYLAASAAVREGIPPDELGSLANLVAPQAVGKVLEHYLVKNDGEATTFVIDLAERLYAIARTYVNAPKPQIQKLERFCKRLRPKRQIGLTRKNMAVVRAFKDPGNRERLKRLPGKLFDEALAERDAPVRAAVKAQLALAIQILLVAPMRLGNLAALSLDENLVQVGKDTYHLVFPAQDVKNHVPLEYPLPQMVNEMMGLYLGVFRPRLVRAESSWLFPGEAKGHKNKGTLSEQIIERIEGELSIHVTPHQFRHLAAAFILEKDPANYEFVRRILGHKNLQTTINFYVGLETVEAVRKFAEIALEDIDWRPSRG